MDLKSINDVFTNRILRIPSYQRGYSWKNSESINEVKSDELRNIKGQLMDLWNDISNISEDKWHYTGLLTLVEVEKCEYSWLTKHRQFAIVDGQQRITSILILIAAMIEEASKLGIELGLRKDDTQFQYLYLTKGSLKAYIFGYEQDNPSDKYFRQHILGLSEIEDDSKESAYTENLKEAKLFFKFMLQKYLLSNNGVDTSAALQVLFDRVTSNLKFNEYVLPKELDEYVVFETMNNRGKPLSELEKLKNRLMYLTDKLKVSDDTVVDDSRELILAQKLTLNTSINTAWITIYQSLGSNKKSPLDDDDFIKNHWITYFDRYNRSESNAHAIHLFNEYFTLQQIYDRKLIAAHIIDYVKSLQQSAVVWNKIHYPSYFESAEQHIRKAVRGLHRVGFRASFKPLVLAALKKDHKDDFIKVIELLEQFAFKLFHVSDRQSNTGDSKLYRLASKIYHLKISPAEAFAEINGHINYYYNFNLFKSQMQELFESGSRKGFYDWSGLHYFLFEYDKRLRQENYTSTHASEINWDDFKNKKTVEHIYPQSASKSYQDFCNGSESPERAIAYKNLQSNWTQFATYTEEQRNRLCNSLGNLLALSHSDNASLSNDSFACKVDQSNKGDGYKNRGYRYDSMSAQIVAKSLEWTPETIKTRGLSMLKAMLSMLGEQYDSFEERDLLKILGLEFMLADKKQ